jgi:hypothetical protein
LKKSRKFYLKNKKIESFFKAIDHELKKYSSETQKECLEKLPVLDRRINHILVYLNCNSVEQEIKRLALLDLFRIQLQTLTDSNSSSSLTLIEGQNMIKIKLVQTLAALKFNESISNLKDQQTVLCKKYEKYLNDYRDFRSIIAAFISASGFMQTHRYEEALPFLCVGCEFNERVTSYLNNKMRGMHHELLVLTRRQCIKQWSQSTIKKIIRLSSNNYNNRLNATSSATAGSISSSSSIKSLNEQEINSLIENMTTKFLPCFFRLTNSTQEDKSLVDEIRQDWLNVLDSTSHGKTSFDFGFIFTDLRILEIPIKPIKADISWINA